MQLKNVVPDGFIKADTPGRARRVSIFLDVGEPKDERKAFLATVDLKRLGWGVYWQRQRGKIDCIWVKGQLRAPVTAY